MGLKRVSFDIRFLSMLEPRMFLEDPVAARVVKYIHYRIKEAAPKKAFIHLDEVSTGRMLIDLGTQLPNTKVRITFFNLVEKKILKVKQTKIVDQYKIDIDWDRIEEVYGGMINSWTAVDKKKDDFRYEHVKLINYKSHKKIKGEVSV